MSIDSRYEGALTDILALFQELAIRLITFKQVDLQKFKAVFLRCYDRMEGLQQEFAHSRPRITNFLQRLRENCEGQIQIGGRTNSSQLPIEPQDHNKPIPKPAIRSFSTSKPSQMSRELISIQEEQEQERRTINSRRSETAGGFRRSGPSSAREQFRPRTGEAGGRKRYLDIQKHSQTIDVPNCNYPTESSANSSKEFQRQFPVYEGEKEHKRSNLYRELQREKQRESDFFSEKECQELFRKYKGKANQRLWQKINRLI